MSTFVRIFLFFILGVYLCDGQEKAGPSLDDATRNAVTKAVRWIRHQRREDYSWGPFTPRAVVALSLAQQVVPISKDDMTIMKKQLNILLSLELGRNISTKNLGLSRLALYVNALYATCQDPRNFHGQDLIHVLRSLTDAALANATSSFSLPVVFVPLCMAQDVRYDDAHKIIKIYNNHRNKTDLQALSLLGLKCIAEQNRSSTIRQYLDAYVTDFLRHYNSIAHTTDVYTLALSLQVLRAVSLSNVDVNALLKKQHPDGSFGSLLSTYYALPALLRKNVYSVKKDLCSNDIPLGVSMSYPLSEPSSPKMYYSVWMGEGDSRDSHTMTVTMPSNLTFFDVMQMAQARNPNFRFSFEERNGHKQVYSVGGVPNDVQRELRWILYETKGETNGPHPKRTLRPVTKGIDKIYPVPEDHFIFWFRRHSSEV